MKNETPDLWDIIVVGGGPAGMMAAGRAAERAREQGHVLRILLLEKNDTLGKKLLITGGGRCNVTNAEFDDRVLLAKFKDSSKFLFSAFAQHNVRKTLAFFNTRGMATKIEAEKRVFPVTDKAQSVWDVMVSYLTATSKDGQPSMVTIGSDSPVTGFVQTKPGIIDGVKVGGETILGKTFIIATGGKSHPETGSTGEAFGWLAKAGHTIVEPAAALVPITVSDSWVKSLSGISLPTAKLTLFQNGVKQGVKKGKILFTHFGLSGPAILNMSAEIGELLQYGEVILSLDLLPEHDYATLNDALQRLFAVESNKKFKNAILKLIPAAFVPVVIERSGIDPDTACNSVTREKRLGLIKLLKDLHIRPTGLLGTDKAIITSGGVALEEVDFRTMQSRRVSNLYLVGDVLNIDRPSGGYSLQLCWTSGWVAGSSAAEALT
jgi:predicted Rossmann fold flavoprotein